MRRNAIISLVLLATSCAKTHSRGEGDAEVEAGLPRDADVGVDASMPPSECSDDSTAMFASRRQTTTYRELSRLEPACDAPGVRPACNAAIHRYCADIGCGASGYGPTFSEGARVDLTCIDANVFIIDYEAAGTLHPVCDGTGGLLGLGCRAAYHRYCGSLGFATGFGAAEISDVEVEVACVDSDDVSVITTSYTVLMTHDRSCTSTSMFGVGCNMAIERYCRASGFNSGFGPVERNEDVAIVACMRGRR